ncbi:MAG: TetR/AcrR family transcriptional regulator, partial [Rhizobiales bacterium]|nr:TetR/AcrR family transcriptional regulator [Hyphomicrobiales bacterium]
ETGLSSGSIYHSFGGKDAVFARVLSHYNDVVVAKRIREHLQNAEPMAGLISLFESLLDEPNDGAFGCLLTNSSIEFAGRENFAAAGIQQGFDLLLSAFKTALMRVPNINEDEAGRMSLRLHIYYQGLLVLIRHGYDKAALRNTIETEIKAITGDLNA